MYTYLKLLGILFLRFSILIVPLYMIMLLLGKTEYATLVGVTIGFFLAEIYENLAGKKRYFNRCEEDEENYIFYYQDLFTFKGVDKYPKDSILNVDVLRKRIFKPSSIIINCSKFKDTYYFLREEDFKIIDKIKL